MLPSEEIKDRINIVDLIGEYVQLKKAGVNFRALCPFHQEKTPSFMVSPTKQIWHCFGCGLGGDIFEFVKQVEAVAFPEALQILAVRAGVKLERPSISYQKESDQKKLLFEINDLAVKFYAKVLAESPVAQTARDYLQKRGFQPETIKIWQLGFAPDDFHTFENFIVKKGYQRQEALTAGLLAEKDGSVSPSQGGQFFDRFRNRIMFPLFDLHGRAVGFTGRILVESEGAAKYVNSPETPIYSKSHMVYGLHLAKTEIRKLNEIIVVEGNVDVITCHEAGFKNVVGSSGTALTEDQLFLLQRFSSNISFAFDIDEAGLKATRRAVELALSFGFNVRIISLPKSLAKDPDELIRRDRGLWETELREAKSFLDFYFERTFANINLDSNVEKKGAAAELLPLVSLLPEALDRSHYANKLALNLGVSEKIILDLLNQHFSTKRANAQLQPETINRGKKTKQELLERRALGLFLKFAKKIPSGWEDLEAEDFSIQNLKEIFLIAAPLIKNDSFNLEQVVRDNPRVAPEIELLIFAVENELSQGTDLNVQDMKTESVKELKLAATKRRMQELAARIKRAESEGRLEEVKNLSSEFNNLTRELTKYHVA